MAWWVYPVVISVTLLFVTCLLCCVVSCVQNRFNSVESCNATDDFYKAGYTAAAHKADRRKDPKDLAVVKVYKS